MKSSILYEVTPRSRMEINRRFGGTLCFHIQNRKVGQENSQQENRCSMLLRNFGKRLSDYTVSHPTEKVRERGKKFRRRKWRR
jgi:hypothetical protein